METMRTAQPGQVQQQEGNPIISYTQFVARGADGLPCYKNLYSIFLNEETIIGSAFRNLPQVVWLKTTHAELYESISQKIKEILAEGENNIHDRLKVIEPQLYQAYTFLRENHMSDAEIFMFKEEPKMSFEQFSAAEADEKKIYNNFPVAFLGDDDIFANVYRKSEHMERFIKEHNDLFKKIQAEMTQNLEPVHTQRGKTNWPLKLIEPDLYRAYCIMRDYGYSDYDLFK